MGERRQVGEWVALRVVRHEILGMTKNGIPEKKAI
jgi:hypothetical protein